MKRILLAVIISFTLLACGHKETTKEKVSDSLAKKKQGTTIKAANDKNGTNEILASYLKIKDALVETNSKTASIAAGELVLLLESSDEITQKLKSDATSIKDNEDIRVQRKHFEGLSNNLYKMIKGDTTNRELVFLQYCPMAFNNKGAYWISDSDEVLNPYFGDRMLRCGNIEEEF